MRTSLSLAICSAFAAFYRADEHGAGLVPKQPESLKWQAGPPSHVIETTSADDGEGEASAGNPGG